MIIIKVQCLINLILIDIPASAQRDCISLKIFSATTLNGSRTPQMMEKESNRESTTHHFQKLQRRLVTSHIVTTFQHQLESPPNNYTENVNTSSPKCNTFSVKTHCKSEPSTVSSLCIFQEKMD